MFKLFAALTALAALAVGATSAPAGSSAAASKIVYHSRLPGLNNDIFIVSSVGGAATRLTRHRGADSNPTLSPDGRRIAFESNRHGNWRSYKDSDVYVMRADGPASASSPSRTRSTAIPRGRGRTGLRSRASAPGTQTSGSSIPTAATRPNSRPARRSTAIRPGHPTGRRSRSRASGTTAIARSTS